MKFVIVFEVLAINVMWFGLRIYYERNFVNCFILLKKNFMG